MSWDYDTASVKEGYTVPNYENDTNWRNKPLTPAQILVHDVRLETKRADRGPRLEIDERSASRLVPKDAAITQPWDSERAAEAGKNPIEKQKFSSLEAEYGWMRHFRLKKYQVNEDDPEQSAKVRWLHCSSKFPEYLRGFLWALHEDASEVSNCFRVLETTVQRQTRFSKHGKYFAPFAQSLQSPPAETEGINYPLLMSVPFLDWSVLGSPPPLRFQVDKREGFSSSKSSAHLLRSILQHFYRLEDTTNRESSQVFARHKPWSTNRELDLKIRQWYGHYPTALNVDELWILILDSTHIVTFSSNQTWKSRWPPLQLTSRITDISFRGIRNSHFTSTQKEDYTSITHSIVSLSGAVGLVHRNFWADFVLPATDRYAGYLSHLQYRLHRSPSTKLVMDLIACQEELNIVIQITQQQLDMIVGLESLLCDKIESGDVSPISRRGQRSDNDEFVLRNAANMRATYRQLSSSTLADPIAQLLDNLQRELTDLRDLRDNTDRLVTRTIQLVNIRLEDHGKAILVFTVVTIIFLPLNFVSSFFGMNVSDIRDMAQTQWLFWAVGLCVTVGVVSLSIFLAFSGGSILEKFLTWKDKRKELSLSTTTALRQSTIPSEGPGFRILGTTDRAATFRDP